MVSCCAGAQKETDTNESRAGANSLGVLYDDDECPHKTIMDAMAVAKSIISPCNAREYSTALPSKIHRETKLS
jgi:hypothetical protein